MKVKRTYPTTNLSEEQLAMQANIQYKAHKYQDAANSYSAAIVKNPTNCQYYMQRALCYEQLEEWHLCVQDCRSIVNIDKDMIEAQFMLATGLMEIESYDEAVVHFECALKLAKEPCQYSRNEIEKQLELARKKRFMSSEEKQANKECELQLYINRLIQDDRKNRKAKVDKTKSRTRGQLKAMKDKIQKECDENAQEINNIFYNLAERRKNREVPDCLLDQISFEIFKDPVITPTGITYERSIIEAHLERNSPSDPITGVHLTKEQLVPNRCLKEAVENFVAQNEWSKYE